MKPNRYKNSIWNHCGVQYLCFVYDVFYLDPCPYNLDPVCPCNNQAQVPSCPGASSCFTAQKRQQPIPLQQGSFYQPLSKLQLQQQQQRQQQAQQDRVCCSYRE